MPRPCSSAPSTILSIRELCSYIGEMGSIGWADFALFGDFATYMYIGEMAYGYWVGSRVG